MKKIPSLSRNRKTPKGRKLKPSDLHVGDKVRVISMGPDRHSEHTSGQNNKVNVRCGILQRASASGKEMDLTRGSSVSTELNLLGMTTDDAVYAVDKYLDEARVAHLKSVRIVHGKGTGALRNAVHAYLRKQQWIKSFRLGDFGEGDAGVTIVTLRN